MRGSSAQGSHRRGPGAAPPAQLADTGRAERSALGGLRPGSGSGGSPIPPRTELCLPRQRHALPRPVGLRHGPEPVGSRQAGHARLGDRTLAQAVAASPAFRGLQGRHRPGSQSARRRLVRGAGRDRLAARSPFRRRHVRQPRPRAALARPRPAPRLRRGALLQAGPRRGWLWSAFRQGASSSSRRPRCGSAGSWRTSSRTR